MQNEFLVINLILSVFLTKNGIDSSSI